MWRFFLTVGALLLSLQACGDSESPAPRPSAASAAVLQLSDLPPGTLRRKSQGPGTPCSPLPLLSSKATALKRTPSFKNGHLHVQESLGFFNEAKTARKVYLELASKARAECIVNSAQWVGRVLSADLVHRPVGERASVLTMRLEKGGKQVEVLACSILQGRAVATLLLVADPAPFPRVENSRILAIASERIRPAKGP